MLSSCLLVAVVVKKLIHLSPLLVSVITIGSVYTFPMNLHVCQLVGRLDGRLIGL